MLWEKEEKNKIDYSKQIIRLQVFGNYFYQLSDLRKGYKMGIEQIMW